MLFLSTTLQSIASTNVKVYFNGKLMEFGTSANDPAPYIKEGRTLIPFRRIFEAWVWMWAGILYFVWSQPKAMALK